MAGQTVGDVQCINVVILEDSNVLEALESFQLTLTASESFITIPSGRESIMINIIEDPLDGGFHTTLLVHCSICFFLSWGVEISTLYENEVTQLGLVHGIYNALSRHNCWPAANHIQHSRDWRSSEYLCTNVCWES